MKGNTAEFPVGENMHMDRDAYEKFIQSWDSYANHATVETAGIKNGSRLMFEYALFDKDGKWYVE